MNDWARIAKIQQRYNDRRFLLIQQMKLERSEAMSNGFHKNARDWEMWLIEQKARIMGEINQAHMDMTMEIARIY